MNYPLTHKMSNGASLGDWLGTSATAASIASRIINDIRSNPSMERDPVDAIQSALLQLDQAITELRAVEREAADVLAHREAFGA